MGLQHDGEEPEPILGGSIDGAPNPKAVGDIDLKPVVPGFFQAVGIGPKEFLHGEGRLFRRQ